MNKETEQLEALTEIRSMMERSSRFISLSGLSGVFSGLFALAGVAAAYIRFDLGPASPVYYEQAVNADGSRNASFYTFFFTDAIAVLLASLTVAGILTMRKAKKNGYATWDGTAKRLLINMFVPLLAGGLFCLALLPHGLPGLVAPAMLVFYGLALFNAGRYTLNELRYLGLLEMLLGLLAMIYPGYGLLFWAVGFGILHIIYGVSMYFKYER